MIQTARVSIIILLLNTLFLFEELPRAIFTSKEIGLFFSISITSFLVSVNFFFSQSTNFRTSIKLNISDADIVLALFFFAIPLIQLLCLEVDSTTSLLLHIAYGTVYFHLRLLFTSVGDRKIFKIFYDAIVFIFTVNLIVGIGQRASLFQSHSSDWISGIFFNSAPYGILLAACASGILTTNVFFITKAKLARLSLSITVSLIACYLIYLTLSRSAALGLIAGILVPLYYHTKNDLNIFYRNNKKLSLIIATVLSALLIMLAVNFYQFKAASANGRILIWLSSIALIKDNALLGVGIGKFAPSYIIYQADVLQSSKAIYSLFKENADITRYAFNDTIHTFAETGIIGAGCFLTVIVLVFSNIKKAISNSKHIALPAFMSLSIISTILTAGVSSFPLQTPPIALLFWTITALAVSLYVPYRFRLNIKNRSIAILFLILGLSYGCYGIIRTSSYISFSRLLNQSTDCRSLSKMLKLYPVLKDDSNFLISLAELSYTCGHIKLAIGVLEQASHLSPSKEIYFLLGKCYEDFKYADSAKKCYKTVEIAAPNLIEPKYLLTLLYYKLGDKHQFKINAKETLLKKPKVFNQRVIDMKKDIQRMLNNIEQ